MEKLVENVSLVNISIAGTPTATPVTPKKTKPTKCKNKVVKPHGLGIFRQKLKDVDESRRTRCPLEVRRSLTRAALLFWDHSDVSVMTAAARMALTFLWHGSCGGASRLGPLRRVLCDMILEQHSHLQCGSFAIAPFRRWRCAEASTCKQHAVEQRATPNSPDEVYS